jgi:hypothetical protein
LDDEIPAPVAAPGSLREPEYNWFRFALVVEYLIALQVVLSVWTEIGGPGHMDLVPWYLKSVCAALQAYYLVRLTSAAVRGESFWNRNSRIWFAGILILGVIMGGITYYYHLHESREEPEPEQAAWHLTAAARHNCAEAA